MSGMSDLPDLPDSAQSGAISAEYDASVRPYIDLIDKLRSYDIEKDGVCLPSIVVVGDQSSGKSSVLEALSGVQLPRGTGMMTRCPLELKLKSHRAVDKWHGVIRYKLEGRKHVYQIEYPEDVEQQVEKAQEKLTGHKDKKVISQELIELEIVGYGVPDLTLIDLPGIIRTTTSSDQKNHPKMIRDLIKKYTGSDTTIIMAVIPANQDLETTEGLDVARQADPDGLRTIGVITKADRVERGVEGEIVDIVMNRKFKLKKGFVLLKCRSAQQVNNSMSLGEALENEKDFFAKHTEFRALPSPVKGTSSLAQKLVRELVQKIKAYNPQLKDKVRVKFDQISAQLKKMGTQVPKSPEAMGPFVYNMMLGFNDHIKFISDGNANTMSERGKEIHTNKRTMFTTFGAKIQSALPGADDKKFLESLRLTGRENRGSQLPGFENYGVFSSHIKEIVRKFTEPALACVNQVFDLVQTVLDNIARATFEMYPPLLEEVNECLLKIYSQQKDRCVEEVEKILQIELQIYTADQTYMEALQQVHAPTLMPQQDPHIDVRETFRKINAYLLVCVRRVKDTVPMYIDHYLIHQMAEEIRTNVGVMVSNPKIGDLVREDPDTEVKRADLQRRHDNLQKAMKELRKF